MTVTKMQTWWDTSQYWDTNVYLPGSANKSSDPNLNASWVSSIQTQGWGLIPTWFGAQPSTACYVGTTPGNCTKYFSVVIGVSSTCSNAYNCGVSEANAAILSMGAPGPTGLALSGPIIYKNIENYITGGNDSAAVKAFLGGWATTLQAAGYLAGVYGNPTPASSDFAVVTPLPDDVWIARSNKQASTWGLWTLGGNSDSALWISDQRIHQYWIDHIEPHGGVSAKIDSDIEDATIVAGSAGVKPFTWLWTIVVSPYSDAQGNSALNFNSINDSGQAVGEYWTGGNLSSGANYTGGTIKTIDEQGITNPVTDIFGVNNLGDMFGQTYGGGYWTLKGSTGKITPFKLNLPSGYNKNGGYGFNFEGRLNDAGQMSGTLSANSGGTVGYLYQAGNYGILNYPAGYNTAGSGLNGQGQVVGSYRDSNSVLHGFVYSLADGFSTIDYPGASATALLAINSNGGILGVANGLNYFLYYSGGFINASMPPFNASTPYATGLDDFFDITGNGSYTPGNGVYQTEGFVSETQR